MEALERYDLNEDSICENFYRNKKIMKELEKNIINLYGVEGQRWLSNLPNWIKQIARAYKLYDLKPVNNLTYNYVLLGFQ